MTIDDDPVAVKARLRAEKEEIERQAMLGQPGFTDYLAKLSRDSRVRAMKVALPDRVTFERWCVLEIATEH
jgi:hypothetical protein